VDLLYPKHFRRPCPALGLAGADRDAGAVDDLGIQHVGQWFLRGHWDDDAGADRGGLVPAAARPAAPVASADRSMARALTVMPASPPIRPAARAKDTSEPARASISAMPGDSVAPAAPSCSSRGASPWPHCPQ
jgi:hypothetical protein